MSFSKLGNDAFGNTITVDQSIRRQGSYIIGASGTGKSVLLHTLALQDIIQGIGVVVIDPNRDLVTNLISCIPQDRLQDVILLDIGNADFPFGLNIYECSDTNSPKAVQYTMDRVMFIWDRLFQIRRENPLMSHYLRHSAHLIIVNPGYTLADIPLIFYDEPLRRKLVANVKDIYVKKFWEHYEHPISKLDRSRETAAVLNKFTEYVQPMILPIIGQSKSTINLRQIFDERKILLLQLDPQMQPTTSLIGSTLIAMILMATYSRENLPPDKRKQVNVYIDELDYFATRDVQQIWQEGRKFGVSLTVAHQSRVKLENEVPELARGILGAGTTVSFRITRPDSEELAGTFDTTPPEPEEIIDEEPWGEEEVKTPVKDVIHHLLSSGSHPDHIVNLFTTKTLRKLIADKQNNNSQIDMHLYELNILLYEAMTQGSFTNFLPIETLKYFLDILEKPYPKLTYPILKEYQDISLSEKLGLKESWGYDYYSPWDYELIIQSIQTLWESQSKSHDWTQALSYLDDTQRNYLREEKLRKLAWELWNLRKEFTGWHYTSDQSYLRGGGVFNKYVPADRGIQEIVSLTKNYYSAQHPEETWYSLDINKLATIPKGTNILDQAWMFYDPTDLGQAIETELEEQKTIFLNFLQDVKQVMSALADNPIDIGSGLYRPVIRQIKHRPPQRTYADMHGEIANRLTRIPNLHAYARTSDFEGDITVTPARYLLRGKQLEKRIQDITQQNIRDGYVRKREDAETEIYARMEPDNTAPTEPALKVVKPKKSQLTPDPPPDTPQTPPVGAKLPQKPSTPAPKPKKDITDLETEPTLPVVKPKNSSIPTPRKRKLTD